MCIFTHDSLSQSVFIYTEYHNSLVRNHSAFTPAYEAHIENSFCMTVMFFFYTVEEEHGILTFVMAGCFDYLISNLNLSISPPS